MSRICDVVGGEGAVARVCFPMTRRQKSGIITSDGSGRFGKGRRMKEKKYARLKLVERKSTEKALGAGVSFKSLAASLSTHGDGSFVLFLT
jgi:hypothetical protein